nr:hypothetical protein [Lachnospiraceae bacterium]
MEAAFGLHGRKRMDAIDWERLTPEQKKKLLFLKQKELLDTFLAHHAISQAQYDKSLGDLTEKMGIKTLGEGPI